MHTSPRAPASTGRHESLGRCRPGIREITGDNNPVEPPPAAGEHLLDLLVGAGSEEEHPQSTTRRRGREWGFERLNKRLHRGDVVGRVEDHQRPL